MVTLSTIVSPNMIELKMVGSDSDGQVSNTIDMMAAPFKAAGELSLLIVRTVGSTNTVSVSIRFSNDGLTWSNALAETDVTGGVSAVTNASGKLARFYQVKVTTVGTGNTLSVFVVIN